MLKSDGPLIADITLAANDSAQKVGEVSISARLVAPSAQPTALMVCLPGGSYSKAYYDFRLDGFENYSFAEHMAQRGIACLLLDNAGMGNSARPDNVGALDKTAVASLHQSALDAFLTRLKAGEWDKALGACPRIGVGHSMGGMLLTEWQATDSPFEQVAFLGWTNTGLGFDTSNMPMPENLPAYMPTDRNIMRPIFHLPDVPEALIAEDNRLASDTPSPIAIQAMMPGIVRREAGKLTCPVLTCFGEIDISPNPLVEPVHFTASPDITLICLAGSAHNHNFAASRIDLWNRLAGWALNGAER